MRAVILALALGACSRVGQVAAECTPATLDFILLEGDATAALIEDDIAADLAKVGITVTSRSLAKADLNKAMVDGTYDMVFSETWGAPYDPHSYVSSWTTPDEAHYSAMKGLSGKLNPDNFAGWVDKILSETDIAKREANWTQLLTEVHEEVIHVPIYGKRIPSIMSTRLSGYSAGAQQYDYPIQKIMVESGSKTITVSPGSQTGLFASVGRLDPHSYRPNEFWASNWVYEGLTAYNANGEIKPSLASKWDIDVDANNVETITFTLRAGVTFHDGADWNCEVAKLNFDHVFAEPLIGPDYHGWYNLPTALKSWSCNSDGKFVVEAKKAYYPLLQELTYIRPLRMLSPLAFVDGSSTSPIANNSCPTGWGTVECWEGASSTCEPITCSGTTAISGTGPFKFISRQTTTLADDSTYDNRVDFESFDDHWNGDSDVDFVRVVHYESSADVFAALKAGNLDAVVGAGVLEPSDIQKLIYDDDFAVEHTDPIMNAVVIMNSAVDLNIRKTAVHAINKGKIMSDLGGIEEPIYQLFHKSAPYCDVYLTPKFDYDLEKAQELNCEDHDDHGHSESEKSDDDDDGDGSDLVPIIFLCIAVAVLGLASGILFFKWNKAEHALYEKLMAEKANEEGAANAL